MPDTRTYNISTKKLNKNDYSYCLSGACSGHGKHFQITLDIPLEVYEHKFSNKNIRRANLRRRFLKRVCISARSRHLSCQISPWLPAFIKRTGKERVITSFTHHDISFVIHISRQDYFSLKSVCTNISALPKTNICANKDLLKTRFAISKI